MPRRVDPGRSSMRAIGEAIELFQLAFLEVAVVRLPLADFVRKGGANMRFFFASQRRSRDIDFDYRGQRLDAFADRVDDVLSSRALAELLRQRQVTPSDPRRSKQTATTRRWKVALAGEASSKIEFLARREVSTDYELRQIDPVLAGRLGGRPVRINRYGPIAMITQKIGALRMRGETQPRDVFDLDLLFRSHPGALEGATVDAAALEVASARALALSYEEYRSTVGDYLEEEVVDVLGTEDAWNDMVLRVTARLDARRAELER